MNVSIIIPNYNGCELLAKNLPILFKSLKNFAGEYEIIVVDDGSTDNSRDFLKAEFPGLKLITLDKNYGFAQAVNRGVKASRYEIIYLMNSDIEVTDNFMPPLLSHFTQKDVFAVSSRAIALSTAHKTETKEWPSYPEIMLVKFKFGIFWYWYESLKEEPADSVEIFVASGGHTAYDKSKFLALGGFDSLFKPFYGEDGDICWRAWKRGWKSLLEPKSKVVHKCKGTVGRFYASTLIQKIHWKNRILMMWKNLTSKGLFLKHIFFLVPGFFICLITGKEEFSLGFLSALKQWPELIRSRRRAKIKEEVYPDKNLFKRFSHLPLCRPFKILYLHETSKVSGAENSLINLVRNIDKPEFNPIFVLPEEGPFSSILKRLGMEVNLIEFPKIRRIRGVFKTVKTVRRLIKQKNICLLHSNSIRTHIYGALAAKLEKIPVVWHERNLITHEIIDPDRLFSFLPDKIICNSYAIAKRFLKRGNLPEKVKVIYNGVDTQKFNPLITGRKIKEEFGIMPDDIVIGIASRFSPDKGHDTFLQAAKIILGERPDSQERLHFLVAGGAVFDEDKWREKKLRELAENIGVSARVIFTGFREDMPEVYAAMDIFVLASQAEPCGRVLFEAMAMGKAVVATDTGGTPEIVADGVTGILVRPQDPRRMAEAVFYLIKDREVAVKMGKAGRKRMKNIFGIIRNVKETQKVYIDLLSRK